MAEPLKCTTEQLSNAIILHLGGELDLGSAQILRDALQSAVQHGHHVVVDLGAVNYVDCHSLHVLQTFASSPGENRRLVLAVNSAPIHRILEILNFHEEVSTFPSTESALKSLSARGRPHSSGQPGDAPSAQIERDALRTSGGGGG